MTALTALAGESLMPKSYRRVLDLITRLEQKSKIQRDGARVVAAQLDRLAEMLGLSWRTVHRAVSALGCMGFLTVTKGRWKRSPRLFIRVSVSPSKPAGVILSEAIVTVQDQQSKTIKKEIFPAGAGDEAGSSVSVSSAEREEKPPQPPRSRLRGSIVEAAARASDRAHEVMTARAGRDDALSLAYHWGALLRAWEGRDIPTDMVTLSHVKTVRKRLHAAGLDIRDELPAIIERWASFAPPKAGKTALPWAVIRALPAFLEYRAGIVAYQAAQAVEKAAPVEPTPAPMVPAPSHKFTIKKPVVYATQEPGPKPLTNGAASQTASPVVGSDKGEGWNLFPIWSKEPKA